MKKLALKFYQKLGLLVLILSFSTSAMASNFGLLPDLFLFWLGYPMMIIGNILLFYLLLSEISEKKQEGGLVFFGVLALANSPIIYFETLEFYASVTHHYTERIAHELPLLGIYTILIFIAVYFAYRLLKRKHF